MNMRSSTTVPLPAPDFDPAAAFPEVAGWRSAVWAGDWPAVSAFIAGFADAGDRSFAVSVVADVPGADVLFEEVARREPSSTLPRVLLAVRHILMGWEVRTGARARHVSAGQFAIFHDHLRRAEQLLIEITAREPWNDMAWAWRLTTAMGLGLGQSEARRRYARLAAHHPNHLPAQRKMLQQLCPKWGGSWEAVHAFARDCLAGAQPGSANGVLVVEAHLERWLEFRDQGKADSDGVKYLRQPEVYREIVDAAARSVLHPEFRDRYTWVSVHSVFAVAFSLMGDYPRAAVHFRALGHLASELPWAYLGDKVAAFERHRAAALAKG